MPAAFVYILRCRDGSLYTGWSTDVERRLARHRAGRASRYTASRLPVELALALAMPDRRAAMRAEARIKALDRPGKLALIAALEGAGERTLDAAVRALSCPSDNQPIGLLCRQIPHRPQAARPPSPAASRS